MNVVFLFSFKNVLFEIAATDNVGVFDVNAKFMGVSMDKVELVFQVNAICGLHLTQFIFDSKIITLTVHFVSLLLFLSPIKMENIQKSVYG